MILAALLGGLSLVSQQPPAPPGVPRVRMTLQQVRVRIVEAVASVEVEQTFRNEGGGEGEADVLVPVPADAVADRFSMVVDGKELPAELLSADKARSIYEAIVRKRRDPGLLEYMGQGLLRARLFPILAGKDVRACLRYQSVVPETAGMHEFGFPLRTATGQQMPPERLSLVVEVTSERGVRNVYTPLAGAAILVRDARSCQLSYESRQQVAPADLRLYYSLSADALGMSLLTHRAVGADGTFLLMATPRRDGAGVVPVAKSLTLVMDTSGSMAGTKIGQARAAIRYFLERLRPEDEFNVIPFASESNPMFAGPVPATPEHVAQALGRVDTIEAAGGTNIGDALSAALRMPADPARVRMVLFVTDGEPTVGITQEDPLRAHLRLRNAASVRLFVLGVGHDVNTRLLDALAEEHHGTRDYLAESESIEAKVASLLDRLSHPVMTDVELVCDGQRVHDVYPRRLPDLFRGERLLVTGRYDGQGALPVRLRGKIAGRPVEHQFQADFAAADERHGFLPALWAQRKVGFLLDQMRLNGANQELADEIQRVARQHGIVTPFTSRLAVEDGVLTTGSDEFFLGRNRGTKTYRGPGGARPPAPGGPTTPGPSGPTTPGPSGPMTGGSEGPRTPPAVGQAAVDLSLALKRLRESGAIENGSAATRRVRQRVFVRVGEAWIESRLTPGQVQGARKVVAFSPEYFALSNQDAELAAVFALGTRVVAQSGKEVVETTP